MNIVEGRNLEGVGDGFHGYMVDLRRSDANGDVGAYQYVQWVMNAFAIFEKATGALIYGPAPGGTLFRGFGGPCEENNAGDPIVLYDQLAHRWVLTTLASTGSFSANQCIAVSETEDATGRYYRYEYNLPTDFPDYPKFGLWPDAYYYSALALGVRGLTCAFDRMGMLAGESARAHCCLMPFGGTWYGPLPADLDGSTPPPPGSPNHFVNLNTDTKKLQLWRFQVNFASPASSKFLGPYPIEHAPFPQFPCLSIDPLHACVPQPGTSQRLWTLGTRVMHRLAYRRFSDHESLVVNHSVHVEPATLPERVGVRWYEIRDPGGTPTVFQQGTFAPDARYRWMGSVAMDRLRNMAVGYSVSSAVIRPSIAIAGRQWDDPLGILRKEWIVKAGSGSQNVRDWGDYTSMSIDPVFDCEFWYTNQYLPENGSFNWKTHIRSFRFPNCTHCVGDCDRDQGVTIDEILMGVGIALGDEPLLGCLRADGNGDGMVTVDEILLAVNYTLMGCGVSMPAAASISPTLQIGSVSGVAGGAAVLLPVRISGSAGELAGAQLDLLFDSGKFSNPSCDKSNATTADHEFAQSLPGEPPPPPGMIRRRLMVYDQDAPIATLNETPTQNAVFSCTVFINAGTPAGTYPITGERQHVCDPSGNHIEVGLTAGSITVLSPSPTPTPGGPGPGPGPC